jgi:putative nucleotidyltransferase with HDIG domain
MLTAADLRSRVERTTNISTVPHIVQSLAALMARPSPSTAEVADEISKDQVLSARVLKLVNSGFCGFRRPISTVHHALVLLGLDVVRTLVMSASVIDIFEEMSRSLTGLWQHSLATARASTAIAEKAQMPNPEELGVAGLLHDIGKLIIAECFKEEFATIRRLVAERDCLQVEAERLVLGVTHGNVGMWLLRKWQLPGKLIYPVGYHNNFHARRDFADRTAVVHLADIITRARGIGSGGDRRVPAIHPDAWAMLDLTMEDVADVSRQLDADMEGEPT